MLGQGDKVTLFGRFRAFPKRRIERLLRDRGAKPLRDLTRSSTHFVVGEGALSSFDALQDRLALAEVRDVEVLGEARLMRVLSGTDRPVDATVPVCRIAGISPDLPRCLHAFDLISLRAGCVVFADAATLKSVVSLEADGMDLRGIIEALLERRVSPKGRHALVIGPNGDAMLQWDDGLTELSGQHLLPLDESDGLDDLFEQAIDAEEEGDLRTAARHFETCAQVDRKDALAAFNLGNVRSALGDPKSAIIAFRQAIARDPRLAEAHYNLAALLEEAGDSSASKEHLQAAIRAEDSFAEAHFNLGQLELADEDFRAARSSFERYLHTSDSGSPLRGKAEKALQLISMSLAKG